MLEGLDGVLAPSWPVTLAPPGETTGRAFFDAPDIPAAHRAAQDHHHEIPLRRWGWECDGAVSHKRRHFSASEGQLRFGRRNGRRGQAGCRRARVISLTDRKTTLRYQTLVRHRLDLIQMLERN